MSALDRVSRRRRLRAVIRRAADGELIAPRGGAPTAATREKEARSLVKSAGLAPTAGARTRTQTVEELTKDGPLGGANQLSAPRG